MLHQELQESPFCNALLDELESLLEDVGASLMDHVLMNMISLLLTWVLASSPSEDVSDQAIALLRSVRRTTFHWVQELLYDLVMEPTNQERSNLLFDMAASCRSTFDVDPAILHKFFRSAEDIDALLSCAFFIYTLRSHKKYSRLLFQRDRRLSLSIEWMLRDVILADASDYGVDLAVSKIFTSYRPSVHSWNHLQYPHDCWLTCESEATTDQPKQTVHINLRYGNFEWLVNSLVVYWMRSGTLQNFDLFFVTCIHVQVQRLTHIPNYCLVQQGFFVISSNLPGMDFMTMTTRSKYKVSVSMRHVIFAII